MGWFKNLALPAAAGLFAFSGTVITPALAQDAKDNTITKDGVIAGTMDIDYGTRTNLDTSGDLKPNSPALGAKDTYKFSLKVTDTTEFTGTVTRQPNLYSKIIASKKQEALITYSIDLFVFNPRNLSEKRPVGKWVGTMPIDTASGVYLLDGGKAKDSPLRIDVPAVGRAAAFKDVFTGKLMGKAEKKDNLAQYTFKRVIGNKTATVVVKKSDPMRFENIVLAKGPAETYPSTSVNGRLDYDYETGNWFTDGIRFGYNMDGADITDVVTGSIKWIEDPDRKANGKGYYEFNLRWNESKYKKEGGEAAAFEKMSDEDAFFAVDNTIPCLTGRISYVDTMSGSDLPSQSKVTYSLNANKLTKQQVMSFFKLWMIAIGPTNDE
jgi:hypothetical protein